MFFRSEDHAHDKQTSYVPVWAGKHFLGAMLLAGTSMLPCPLLISPLMAQSDNSSIVGSVTDPSGAVVKGASITVIQEATATERKTSTNASGFYTVNGVSPGKYTVRVDAAGFNAVTIRNNSVDPSIPATVNITLAVGSDTQLVEVEAAATMLQADSSTLGRVITSNQVENLPLSGRNPIYVALTKAGITSGPTGPVTANSSGTGSNVSSFNFSTGLGAIQINGGRDRDNLITYDGAVAVRIRASGDSVGVPDLDAVQEVQVLATNYPAEYGRSIGGQIRIVTKSGGNRFHGSVYEYFQNPVLNANSWVRNHNTVNNNNPLYPSALKTNFVAPFTYNQFGFNFNGPLYIPRVLPKGKVFFLYSEAFVRYPQTVTNAVMVPNPAFQTGDFSSVAAHIRDPLSKLPCDAKAGGPGCFQNNMIPKSQLSPNGVGLLAIFPAPTPNFLLGTNNLLQIGKYPAQQQIDSGNLDIVPTEKDYIRFRLVHFFYHEDNPFSAAYSNVPRLYDRPNQTGSIDWVHTFGAKMTNEVLLTASHDAARLSIDTSGQAYNGKGPAYSRSSYGVNYPFLFPGTKDLADKIPTVKFDNTNITSIDGSAYPSHSQGEIFDFADTVTRVVGDHTLRAGALYERAGENDRDQIAFSTSTAGQTNNQNGQFNFIVARNPNTSNSEVADAALGNYFTYSEVGARAETPYRGNMYEFFLQDSFKATPKLHLEFGIRYTSIHPFYSLWNNAGSFDPAFYNPANAIQVSPTTGNPIAGTGDPLNGTVLWGNGFTDSAGSHVPAAAAGQYASLFHNLPRGYIHVQKYLLQPRVGIAYSLTPKTVLRTGFGRYTNRQGVSDFVFAGGIPPLQQVASVSSGTVDNPGAGANGSYPTLSGDIDRSSPQPEAYIWNASVEREIGFGTVAEVSYVGRHALHQQYGANINQLQPGTLKPTDSNLKANSLRPYAGYSAINLVKQGSGAFYQGLQVDVNRRFSHGLGLGVAYTFASSRDCASFQKSVVPNTYDPKAICGPSDYDIRQVMAINSVYEIPFKSNNRLLKESLGGWQLTQSYQFQTGAPFSVATTQDIAGVGVGSGPQLLQMSPGANLKGNGKFSDTNTDSNSWFKVVNGDGSQIFTTAPASTFTPQRNRNILRAPGQEYFNASIQKRFPTFEGQFLAFRFDAFDFLNHPNWNSPDSTYVDQTVYGNTTSPTFGKVTSKNNQRSMQASLRYSF